MKNKICKFLSFLVTMVLLAGLIPAGRAVNAASTYKMTLLTDQPECKVEYLGTQYSSGAEFYVEAGTTVWLYAKATGDCQFKSADSPDVEVNRNGSIGYAFDMPEKDVTVTFHFEGPGPYDMEFYSVDLGTAEIGYNPSDFNKSMQAKKTGSATVVGDKFSVKLTSGNTDAFTVTDPYGGAMTVKGAEYHMAYVYPVAGLAAGTYDAVVTLYYDPDGNGTEYSPEEIDFAHVQFTVISNVTYKLNIITDYADGKVEYNKTEYTSGQSVDIHEGELVHIYGQAPEGYTFAYAQSPDIEINRNGSIGYIFNMPAKDITVYFYFDSNTKHTVKFDTGDGSGIADQSVPDGKTVKIPEDPTLEGYVFWGWYTNPECTKMYDFATPVTEDLTLYAYWTKNISGFGFDAIGTLKSSDGNTVLNVRSTDVVFDLESADINMFVSPFYADKYFNNLATGGVEKGKEYYFYIELDDADGIEGRPTVYYSNDLLSNLEIYTDGSDIVATEISRSPGGKFCTILFKYVLDESYKGGWIMINDEWYFVEDSGETATGWKSTGGKWYYFDANGIMQTGWLELDGAWYYLEGSGAMAKSWKQIGGVWYYFGSNGKMLTNWQQIGGKWYYFKNNGAMVTGWQQISGKWYCFESSGAMITGWLSVDGVWYYFDASGAMVTGWKEIGGVYYFFKTNGTMAANEYCGGYRLDADGKWTYTYKASWKKDSKGWWYGDSNGWYAKNETWKIDGKDYNFDKSGYCTNP